MTQDNGVIRIGKKGLKKFALGDGPVFELDVVAAFQGWVSIYDGFLQSKEGSEERFIPTQEMPAYHESTRVYVRDLQSNSEGAVDISVAEALDFVARLREQYEELAVFFRPKLQEEPDSRDTSGVELRFSEEAPAPDSQSSTSTSSS